MYQTSTLAVSCFVTAPGPVFSLVSSKVLLCMRSFLLQVLSGCLPLLVDFLSKDDWLEHTLDSTTLSPAAANEGKPGHMRALIKATSIFQSVLLCLRCSMPLGFLTGLSLLGTVLVMAV
ncbi:hypothetical protein XENORESO_018156 [Xenotaenia resolanae]|uniref:Uncharacterized protein n=1 Tax=Xenotaenia resolanae TaxID=208358 RepID=A0ABV0W3E3_9TELE